MVKADATESIVNPGSCSNRNMEREMLRKNVKDNKKLYITELYRVIEIEIILLHEYISFYVK